MKRCPQCYQTYEGTGIFCENDGQRLLDLPALVVKQDELVPDIPQRHSNSTSVAMGLAGVLIGVLLCGGAYLAYSLLKPESDTRESARSPFETQARENSQPRPAPARTVEAAATPSESPTPEPEVVASPEPAQPAADTVAARLNRGPVSTGEPPSETADGKVKTIIEMQDGSILEVDAAWKDAQGVWYRRGGLVSFVESPRVKAITERAEPTAPAASNP